MIDKIFTLLACFACIRADIFSTHSSVPTVEVYPSINNGPGTRRLFPTTPAPIYEDNMDDIQPAYGSQRPLLKVLNIPFANAGRSANSIVNIGHHSSVYPSQAVNQVFFQPAYNPQPVIARSLSAPVTHTTHTYSTPLVNAYSRPVVATSYGQPAFASHTPVASQAVETTISYSEAPVVSHVTFTGHGTRFSW